MNSLAMDNRSRVVGGMEDMRSKVFGGAGCEALRASFAPAATAGWLGGSAKAGPLTGSAGVRLGGTVGAVPTGGE